MKRDNQEQLVSADQDLLDRKMGVKSALGRLNVLETARNIGRY
jgi:hypothetical protein